jgi:hypothetical protein
MTDNPPILIEPTNAAHPSTQLLCYYCQQPIAETVPEAGYKNRTVYMRGRWRHRDGDALYCERALVRPDSEIDQPRCGCCGTQTERHRMMCSHAGKPPYRATPFSEKENEIERFRA